MANRYWVGGTGNWSDNTNHWSDSSGGSPGASVPTSSDNVYFDASSGSGTVTLDITSGSYQQCLDFDASASSVTTFAGSGKIYCYGSFTLGSGITMGNTGDIYFMSTSTGKTITFAGNEISSSLRFDGVGGGWTFQDNLTFGANYKAIYINDGSVDFNETTVDGFRWSFYSNSSTTRSIDATNATFTMVGTVYFASTNLTFSGSGSTIIINELGNGAGCSFSGAGQTFGDVTAYVEGANTSRFSGENTFANLSIYCETFINVIFIHDNQTVTGTFTAEGSSARLALIGEENSQKTITAATVSCESVDILGIEGAGTGSWDLSSNDCGDMGNNTGITFPATKTRYWVDTDGGGWGSTTSWSTSSGGSSGASVPLCHDTVVFDSNSISVADSIITTNSGYVIPALDFSNLSTTISFRPSERDLFTGSIDLTNASGPIPYDLDFYTGESVTLKCAGYEVDDIYIFYATLTLQDSLTADSFRMYDGATCDFNDSDVSASTISLYENCTLYMGNGTVTVDGSYNVFYCYPSNTTVYPEGSELVVTDTSSNYKRVQLAPGCDLNTVTFTGNNTQIYGLNRTINTLNLNNAGEVDGTVFQASQTININNFTTNGSSGNLAKITSSSTTTASTINYTGATYVEEDYLDVSNITGTPDFSWYVGANSVDGGGNTGLYFIDAPIPGDSERSLWLSGTFADSSERTLYLEGTDPHTRYWIGGTGNWSDAANWSTSSGGSANALVPTSDDDVYIDSNSGFGSGGTLTIDGDYEAKSITADEIGSAFTIEGEAEKTLTVTNGVTLKGTSGNLITINADIQGAYYSVDSVTYSWDTLTAGATELTGSDDGISGEISLPFTFTYFGEEHDSCYVCWNGAIRFDNNSYCDWHPEAIPTSDSGYVNSIFGYECDLDSSSGGTISYETLGSVGSRVFIVEFDAVPTYTDSTPISFQMKLYEADNHIEVHTLSGIPNSSAGTALQGVSNADGTKGITYPGRNAEDFSLSEDGVSFTPSSTQFNLLKSSGSVTCDYLWLLDTNASGGATWYAGDHSYDISNNDGWTFSGTSGSSERGLWLSGDYNSRYWVGGTGTWEDTSHWSTTSGGSGGASLPDENSNVFIDNNSGLDGGTLTFTEYVYFHDFTSDTNYSYTLAQEAYERMYCYGSFIIEGNVTTTSAHSDNSVNLYMYSDGGSEQIKITGSSLTCRFFLGIYGSSDFITIGDLFLDYYIQDADCTVTLGGNLTMGEWGDFWVNDGTFDANDYNVTCSEFYVRKDPGDTTTVYMGSGTWEIFGGYFYGFGYGGEEPTIHAETSTIKIVMDYEIANYNYFYFDHNNESTTTSLTFNNLWVTGIETEGEVNMFFFGKFGTYDYIFNEVKIDAPTLEMEVETGMNVTANSFEITGSEGDLIEMVSPYGVATDVLATSDNFDVSTLTTSYTEASFTFSGDQQIVLEDGKKYLLACEYVRDYSNYIRFAADSSSPAHSGDMFRKYNSTDDWLHYTSYADFCFSANSSSGVIDSYDYSNYNGQSYYTRYATGYGQTITGDGSTLTSASFWLLKYGAPTGNATVKVIDLETQYTFTQASGTPTCQYLDISDSNVTGGATWIAENSVDSGSNTGWAFTGSSERDLWLSGGLETDSERALWLSGGVASSSERDFYLSSKAPGESERDLYLVGSLSGGSERDMYLSGKADGNSERELYLSGYISTDSERSLHLQGNLPQDSERTMYLSGGITQDSERDIYLASWASGSDSRTLYLASYSTDTSERTIWLSGGIKDSSVRTLYYTAEMPPWVDKTTEYDTIYSKETTEVDSNWDDGDVDSTDNFTNEY